jgi:hypothetical protein
MQSFNEWFLEETYFLSIGTLSVKSNGIIIIAVDPDLGEYYKKQFNNVKKYAGFQIMKPKWGPHVSITREPEQETYSNPAILAGLDGKPISFKYSHKINGDGKHWWLDVHCEEALDIREKLGLSRQPPKPLHVTIGVIVR